MGTPGCSTLEYGTPYGDEVDVTVRKNNRNKVDRT